VTSGLRIAASATFAMGRSQRLRHRTLMRPDCIRRVMAGEGQETARIEPILDVGSQERRTL